VKNPNQFRLAQDNKGSTLKTKTWFNLAIYFINVLRPIISALLFINFFQFRMVNVTCLFLAYLILDSSEGAIVFCHRDIWGFWKLCLHYLNYIIFLFAVTAGFLLYQPLLHFMTYMGFNVEDFFYLRVWGVFTSIFFIAILALGYSTQQDWGNIQNLLARLAFLLYCFQYIPNWAIFLSLITVFCIIMVEVKKYGWSLKELMKKDIRFRHLLGFKKIKRYPD